MLCSLNFDALAAVCVCFVGFCVCVCMCVKINCSKPVITSTADVGSELIVCVVEEQSC